MFEVYHFVQLPLFKTSKVCTACEKEKPIDDFYRQPQRSSDGYKPECKVCYNARRKAYKAANHEKVLTIYQQSYIKHRDERIIKGRVYREENQEIIFQRRKQYIKANPLKLIQQVQKRNALKNQATTGKVDLKHILERDGMWCYICEQEIKPDQKIDFDHVIPLARGGAHTEENIKVTHSVCNRRKRALLLEEMAPYHRRGV